APLPPRRASDPSPAAVRPRPRPGYPGRRAEAWLGHMGCFRRVVTPIRFLPMRAAAGRFGTIAVLAIVMGAIAPWLGAFAQEGEKPGTAVSGEERPVRFRVEIDGPRRYEAQLRERLPLMRWQASEEVTLPLLRRLVEEARAETLEALATDGYFSATVRTSIDEAADEAVVRLQIEPGPRTRVES